jgi:mono/diheme cytochrome c family protein/heme/copper-type cytochrome/quinol oxidase subunit 4
MAKRKQDSSTATYVIIAIILGLITYIEFAIVEYKFDWLPRGWVMFWLALLSVIKFILVIMFFMHLKEDDKVYTGFFASGMLLALGSFIGLIFLFTVVSVSNYTFTNVSPTEVVELAQPLSPEPKDQSAVITPPAAAPGGFEVGPEGQPAAVAEAPLGGAVAAAEFDRANGQQVYATNCSSCHQAEGQGIPGAFPPLADHASEIYNAPGGREVLIHTVLFGLQGEIDVHGVTYNGLMPAWPQLSDADIANVIDHVVTAWGNEAKLVDFQPVTAAEVAAERSLNLSSADVHAQRVALDLTAAPGTAEAVEPEEAEPAAVTEAEAAQAAELPAPAEAEAEFAEAVTEAEATAVASTEWDKVGGQTTYSSSCASCHQPGGQGIPSVFPPLADHVPELYNAEGGREYLIHAVLYGLQGPIDVHGTTYNGSMPAWQQLADQKIADVISYIATEWGNEAQLTGFLPITPDEILAARTVKMTPAEVHAQREALDLTGTAEVQPAAAEAAVAEAAALEEAETVEAEAVVAEAVEAEAEAEAVSAEEAAEEVAAVAATLDFDRANGEAVYTANCTACHQAQGQGIPGAFPPLADHASHLFNAEGGRETLIHILLFGLTGEISVNGVTYNNMMPAWQQLSDGDIADVIDYIVTSWGNEEQLASFTPVTAAEVAAERGANLSTSQVHAQRVALDVQ